MKLEVQGQTVFAYTGGKAFDAQLPCVLLLHGALNDHSVFSLLARWLAHHGYAVLAPDLPGHGQSEGSPLSSVEDAAAWAWALLDAAGAQRAALCGHSMGSLIALQAAAMAPDRATHLILIATAVPMAVGAALLQLAQEQAQQAIDMVSTLSISGTASKPAYPGPGSWLHGGSRALMQRLQHRAQRKLGINLFAHDFAICNAYQGGLQAAAAVRCKSSLILGQHDRMTAPSSASALATALRAPVHLLPAGHFLMGEAPDGVLNALRKALTS